MRACKKCSGLSWFLLRTKLEDKHHLRLHSYPRECDGTLWAWNQRKTWTVHNRGANATTKNVGVGKFWQDLEISEAFLISLEVFLHGLFLLFSSLKTFYQRVLGSDFWLGSWRLVESRILPFATPHNVWITEKRI